MSVNRKSKNKGRIRIDLMAKGDRGNPLCRFCFTETDGKLKTFCSSQCLHEHKLRSDSSYLRKCVERRDRGVCNHCKFDTKVLMAKAIDLVKKKKRWTWGGLKKELDVLFAKYRYPLLPETRPANLKRLARFVYRTGIYWHADHILAVKNGGGECSLKNMQTLCVPCHKDKTRVEC